MTIKRIYRHCAQNTRYNVAWATQNNIITAQNASLPEFHHEKARELHAVSVLGGAPPMVTRFCVTQWASPAVPAGGRHIMEGSNLQAPTKQNLQRTLPAKCHSGTNLLAEKK